MNYFKSIFSKRKANRLYRIGMSYFQDDNFLKALDFFNESISVREDSEVYHIRGLCNFYLSEFEQAIMDLDKSIVLDPEIADFYYSRGFVYGEYKEYDKSIQNYRKCIDLDSKQSDAYYGCAHDLFELGKYRESADYYHKFLDLNSKPVAIQLYMAALSFDKVGDVNSVQKLMIEAAELGNEDAKKYCSTRNLLDQRHSQNPD